MLLPLSNISKSCVSRLPIVNSNLLSIEFHSQMLNGCKGVDDFTKVIEGFHSRCRR